MEKDIGGVFTRGNQAGRRLHAWGNIPFYLQWNPRIASAR